jgi:hypothetical protein
MRNQILTIEEKIFNLSNMLSKRLPNSVEEYEINCNIVNLHHELRAENITEKNEILDFLTCESNKYGYAIISYLIISELKVKNENVLEFIEIIYNHNFFTISYCFSNTNLYLDKDENWMPVPKYKFSILEGCYPGAEVSGMTQNEYIDSIDITEKEILHLIHTRNEFLYRFYGYGFEHN